MCWIQADGVLVQSCFGNRVSRNLAVAKSARNSAWPTPLRKNKLLDNPNPSEIPSLQKPEQCGWRRVHVVESSLDGPRAMVWPKFVEPKAARIGNSGGDQRSDVGTKIHEYLEYIAIDATHLAYLVRPLDVVAQVDADSVDPDTAESVSRPQQLEHVPAIFRLEEHILIGANVGWAAGCAVAFFFALCIRNRFVLCVSVVGVSLELNVNR